MSDNAFSVEISAMVWDSLPMPVLDKPQHEIFAVHVVKHPEATGAESAIAAGYSKKTAYSAANRLLKIPEIKDRINELLAESAEKATTDAAWVLRKLKELHDRCMQATPVLDRKGKPVMVETPDGELAPAYTFQAPTAAKSLELIGKHVGVKAFEDVVRVNGLDALAERLARAAGRDEDDEA